MHRQTFEPVQVEGTVEEVSVDGGKVRLRTPQGQPSEWRDSKAVNLHEWCIAAFFQDNECLVNWVNAQPLSDPLTCLGDGHEGIWNIYAEIGTTTQRREIDVEGAIAQFEDWQHERVTTFIGYLNKHRHRIVNSGYYQAEGISIGSGAIESTVKQIGRRIKISGSQWAKDNVPQVLKQRSAYLNGQFSK
ncbi:MAG: hypothetical protein HC769_31620 [Cyanobacteria bacterium CRU_2_1]|nr:hypothetical protein [Cyanobacteria bacterium CRU_2_1]